MKVLSFLGTTNYSFTKYKYGDKVVPTRFFAEALPQFFPETEQILVFVTPTVQRHTNLEELQSRLGKLLKPVPIPESHTEDALWSIFTALIEEVKENETVVFDITNSFRSIPFLVFIAAAFLRSVRKVKVKAVLYGAFEAKNDDNISPVFDLTLFVTLFDWLSAANQFIYTGNARYLASQLRKNGQNELEPLASNVDNIALALELLRPRDVAQAAQVLPQNLRLAMNVLPAPFGTVANAVEAAYAQFGLPANASPREHLKRQLQMINWYLEKQHYVHAISMAREWVVSLLCVEFGLDMWNKNDREEMEFLLAGGKRKNRETGEEETSPWREQWRQHKHRKKIVKIWSGKEKGEEGAEFYLANLRNDVLHSGFRKSPKDAVTIIEQTKRIIAEINNIARLWNLN